MCALLSRREPDQLRAADDGAEQHQPLRRPSRGREMTPSQRPLPRRAQDRSGQQGLLLKPNVRFILSSCDVGRSDSQTQSRRLPRGSDRQGQPPKTRSPPDRSGGLGQRPYEEGRRAARRPDSPRRRVCHDDELSGRLRTGRQRGDQRVRAGTAIVCGCRYARTG